jgi:condensin complex subunit 3
MDSQASSMGTPGPKRMTTPRADDDDPEVRMKAALVDLRCLMICISLLERVNTVSLCCWSVNP